MDGDGSEMISNHACVYNASSTFPGKAGRGVLRDNQVKPLLIEDCDRLDKFSARKAFLQFWSVFSKVRKVRIVSVYEIIGGVFLFLL